MQLIRQIGRGSKKREFNFAPFRKLFIELFQLLSFEPITEEQGNKAFESAVWGHLLSLINKTGAAAVLSTTASLMVSELIDSSIIRHETFPNRHYDLWEFFDIVFNKQHYPVNEKEYNLNELFQISKIETDHLENKKFHALYFGLIRWYLHSYTLSPDAYTQYVEKYYSRYPGEDACILEEKEKEAITDKVDTILSLIFPHNCKNAFQLKKVLLNRTELFCDLSGACIEK